MSPAPQAREWSVGWARVRSTGSAGVGGQPDHAVDVEGEQHVRPAAPGDDRVALRGGPGRPVAQRLVTPSSDAASAAFGVTTSGETSHQPSGSRPSTTSSGTRSRSAASFSRSAGESAPRP